MSPSSKLKINLPALWKSKSSLIGAFQLLADPIASEHFAHVGYDVVCVDLQHGLLSEQHAIACVRALSAFSESCVPIIRISSNDASCVHRALDGGALGVIAPMVDTAEEAELLVYESRYNTARDGALRNGGRSFGPTRPLTLKVGSSNAPSGYDVGIEVLEELNASISTFAMIETKNALDACEDIIKAGLSLLFV